MILRKDEYPSLFKVSEDVQPEVSITEESIKKQGIAGMRVTVSPNMEMRYYRSAKVLWVQLIR